jgi:chromosome segregation ATPase
MKSIWLAPLLIAGALVPAHAGAQDAQGRRAALEAQVFSRFLDRIATELELSPAKRDQLAQALHESAQRRRTLAQEAWRLHAELARLANDPNSRDDEISRTLTAIEELRDREHALWRDEQRALAAVLSPRQRAHFMVLRTQFNERALEMRGRRHSGGPPGDGPARRMGDPARPPATPPR